MPPTPRPTRSATRHCSKRESSARQDYDLKLATFKALEASLAADRSAIDNARLQVEYCHITSPIEGRTGNVLVKEGNIVKANDVPLVNINQIRPIYVAFSVPESEFPAINKRMADHLRVQATITGDTGRPVEGELTFADNSVDQTTGTIRLKATFPNTDNRLWPGQFVNVVLTVATQSNAIIAPSQAVQTGQNGQFVFVVKPDNKVEMRPVVLGRAVGNEIALYERRAARRDGGDRRPIPAGSGRRGPGGESAGRRGCRAMSIPEFFIRRAVTTTLMMAGLLGFGILSYRKLPVSDLPNVDFPTISVNASLPGASPETMAASVATPLERQFSTIAGVDSMTSTSLLGGTSITIQFVLDRSIDAAAQDVQSAISKASRQLPQGMPAPPSYQKVNPADQPVMYLALSSPTLPLSTVDEYAETLMAQRISMVDGVAQVAVFGSQKYAVRIQLDPDALAAKGIGIDQVESAIEQSNVNLPTGTLWGKHQAFTVQATGQLMRASDYRPMIVAYRNGNPVRLRELGRVIDSVENDKVGQLVQ